MKKIERTMKYSDSENDNMNYWRKLMENEEIANQYEWKQWQYSKPEMTENDNEIWRIVGKKQWFRRKWHEG